MVQSTLIIQFRVWENLLLELFDVKVDATVFGVVSTVPEDLLSLLNLVAVAINGEPGVAALGEVALVVDTKGSGVGTLGDGTGVGYSQTNGRNLALNDVEALEGSGDGVLTSERDSAVGAALEDSDLVSGGVGIDPEVV